MRAARLVAVTALALAACQHVGPAGEDLGEFTFAGLTLGTSKYRTVRWAYRFQFRVDPKTVTAVRLSCGDIQGSSVVAAAEDIAADENRVATWYGPESLLSNESLPWLYSGGTTSAICQGVFSRDGEADSVERISVTFSQAKKKRTAFDLENAWTQRRSSGREDPPTPE